MGYSPAAGQSLNSPADDPHAWTKSLIGNLKNEMIQGGSATSEADARIEIPDLIVAYFNHHRKHEVLRLQTPALFVAENQQKKSNKIWFRIQLRLTSPPANLADDLLKG